MSQNHEQYKYTKDFLKGQEPHTQGGYLQGNNLAGKYNPGGMRKLYLMVYTLIPLALISAGLLFIATSLTQTLIFLAILLLCLWGIYKTFEKIKKH
jgi:hypothetical protein